MNQKKSEIGPDCNWKRPDLAVAVLGVYDLTSCSSSGSALQLDCHWTGCDQLQLVLVGISQQFSDQERTRASAITAQLHMSSIISCTCYYSGPTLDIVVIPI